MRGRTGLGDPLLFKILWVFLGGGVAEVNSAAIPGRGLNWVVRNTANPCPAQESGVKGRAQPQRRAPVSSIGRSFVEEAGRYDVSGAQEIIAAGHERGHFCGGQALVGRGLPWRWGGGERCRWRGRLFLCRTRRKDGWWCFWRLSGLARNINSSRQSWQGCHIFYRGKRGVRRRRLWYRLGCHHRGA